MKSTNTPPGTSASTATRSDPLASPLHAADLSGLPPAVLTVAELDVLCGQGERYLARLHEAGVPGSAFRVARARARDVDHPDHRDVHPHPRSARGGAAARVRGDAGALIRARSPLPLLEPAFRDPNAQQDAPRSPCRATLGGHGAPPAVPHCPYRKQPERDVTRPARCAVAHRRPRGRQRSW
ncbi:alpha/beta hydrolase fold domain-containing protein [Yinghuangia aomiensis]